MEVTKTIKLYMNGDFVRSESGRTIIENTAKGEVFANLCLASKKDLRNAVESSSKGYAAWTKRTPFNRSQIIYRIAEMFEAKREEFYKVYEQVFEKKKTEAEKLVTEAIDNLVYFAGFCDKYQTILGNINPVNGPYLNYTDSESVGVSFFAQDDILDLPSIVGEMAAALATGNSIIMLLNNPGGSFLAPLSEVIATSDVPAGVVNLLNGNFAELVPCAAKHREVNLIKLQSKDTSVLKEAQESVTGNLKRISFNDSFSKDINALRNYVEMKTVWHPMGY